jgi:hypothetical protein
MNRVLAIILIFTFIPVQADILYIKLNPAQTELAEVKRIAKERGEKLHLIPPKGQTVSPGELDSYIKKVKQNLQTELKTVILSSHHTQSQNNKYYGHDENHQNKSKIYLDGENGLFKSLKKNQLDTFTSIITPACNSTTEINVKKWLNQFPYLAYMCGYIESAPKSNRPANLDQLEGCLDFTIETYDKLATRSLAGSPLQYTAYDLNSFLKSFSPVANFGYFGPVCEYRTVDRGDLNHADAGARKGLADLFTCEELKNWLYAKYKILRPYLADPNLVPQTKDAILLNQFFIAYEQTFTECPLHFEEDHLHTLGEFIEKGTGFNRVKEVPKLASDSDDIRKINLTLDNGSKLGMFVSHHETRDGSTFLSGTMKASDAYEYIGDFAEFKKGGYKNYIEVYNESTYPEQIQHTTYENAVKYARALVQSNELKKKETFIVTYADPQDGKKHVYLLYR